MEIELVLVDAQIRCDLAYEDRLSSLGYLDILGHGMLQIFQLHAGLACVVESDAGWCSAKSSARHSTGSGREPCPGGQWSELAVPLRIALQ